MKIRIIVSSLAILRQSRFRYIFLLSSVFCLFVISVPFPVAAQGVSPFFGQSKPVEGQIGPNMDKSTITQPATTTEPKKIELIDATASPKVANINPTLKTSPSPTSLSSMPNPGITLMFDNADIYDVLKVVLGDALSLDYVVDPSVQGRITLKSTGAVNLADILSILETALSTVNVSIVKQGSVYKIIKEINSARETLPSIGVGPASPVLQIIPVKFVQASQLANTVRSFIGPQALISNDPTNRYLIVADRAANVAKVVEMVAVLDVDYLQQVSVRLFPLSFTDVADVVKDLDGLFKTSGVFNWPGTDGTKVYFLPVVRANAVLVATANEKLMLSAEQWIKTLDAEPKNGLESFVHIYPVLNGNAPHLADLLRQIFGGSTNPGTTSRPGGGVGGNQGPTSTGSPLGTGGAVGSNNQMAPTTVVTRGNVPSQSSSSGNVPGLGGSVQIIADEITNTIVVRSTLQDYKQIRKVLERLDITAKQVLIQVMVAEVALNDTLQYGVEWWLNDTLKFNGQTSASKVGLGGLVKPTDVLGIVSGTGGGLTYSVLNTTGQIIGLLNLLGQDTNVNVLSTPHVMASDGKLARIEVGDEVAVVTQTSSTPNALGGASISNSVTYRPTGIILEVTPVISASGKVSLTVSQEVSNVQAIGSTVGGVTYPNFSKRKVSTEVIVDDGKPLLIAGLIRDSGNNNVAGIPGFKDIPILGALFGSTKKIRDKTELIMSITSFIVNDKADGERITNQFQSALKDLKPILERNKKGGDKAAPFIAQ